MLVSEEALTSRLECLSLTLFISLSKMVTGVMCFEPNYKSYLAKPNESRMELIR
jgi:hypothetical protein